MGVIGKMNVNEKSVCESFGIRAICFPDNGRMTWGGGKMIYEYARYDLDRQTFKMGTYGACFV